MAYKVTRLTLTSDRGRRIQNDKVSVTDGPTPRLEVLGGYFLIDAGEIVIVHGLHAWALRTSSLLLWVPVKQPDLNASPFQSFLKYGEIGSAIVIGDDNIRVERSDRISSLIGWHGVGQIHAHERHVDVLERTHLGDAFGVAGEVEALAAVREDVAIAASLVVKEFSRGGAALQVVRGDSFNGPVPPGFGFSIGNGLGARDGLDHC